MVVSDVRCPQEPAVMNLRVSFRSTVNECMSQDSSDCDSRGAPQGHQEKGRPVGFPDGPSCLTAAPPSTGDFRASAPGADLPAASYSGAAAHRDSRDLEPDPSRWLTTSVRCRH
jgi:hypothetical protein